MRRWIFFGLLVLGLSPAVSVRETPAQEDPEHIAPRTSAEMSRQVDQLLARRWGASGITAAEPSDDAEFFRRLHLDLTGNIPTVADVRNFLDDESREKRSLWVDRLLHSPTFASHLAVTWRNRLLPRGFELAELENAIGLENWLRQQFLDNLRYDNLVAEFLVAQGDGRSGPALYYTSLELKPEKLAASSARIFLGVQMECAECHDHPFDHWTQRDFWSYAAFFAQLEPLDSSRPGMARIIDRNEGEVRLPQTDNVVTPRFPGGLPVPDNEYGTRRSQLAIWMASRDNPYLARSAVNAVWAHLFGRGLVHPMDDHSEHNPPSHPELLAELSEYLVVTDFDLKELFRVLVNSEAYQLSSKVMGMAPPPQLFAVMQPKTLTSEQLFDSIRRACGAISAPVTVPGQTSHPLRDPQRLAFVSRMPSDIRDATEFQSGLPQALLLMNGPVISAVTDPPQSRLLQALSAPLWTGRQQIEILYLATLSRYPTEVEEERIRVYLETYEPKRRLEGLSDVLWALLNSAEFMLNH
jgi:hypothetical protein